MSIPTEEGEADVGTVAGAVDVGVNEAEAAAERHNFESADILLMIVSMMEFDTRSRLAPSPLKLPLKIPLKLTA